MSALVNSIWNSGIVVFIPENVIREEPINLDTIFDQDVSIEQLFVIIEPHAQATIIDGIKTARGIKQTLFRSVIALVDHHAHLSWMYDHNLSNNSSEQSSYAFLLYKESNLHSAIGITSGSQVNVSIDILLQEEGARAQCVGYYLVHENKKYALITQQKHMAAHTESLIVINGVLQEQAYSLYTGTIKINQHADYANARQVNKNLIIGQSAHAISIPNLEVHANKVQCYHGSAVGKILSDHLAYLQARGISADVAQKMLVKGFLEESLSSLPSTLSELIHENLTLKLPSFFT